jgi:hypothetical protein
MCKENKGELRVEIENELHFGIAPKLVINGKNYTLKTTEIQSIYLY